MDIKDIIKIVKDRLHKADIKDLSETEWLIAEALGIKRSGIYMQQKVSDAQVSKIMEFVEKREKHIPLDYITGKSYFYGLEFAVNSNVLIPRPETELLVEEVIKEAKDSYRVLDIGTGSGAIAVSIKNNTNTIVKAVDISLDALQVAKQNAKNNAVDIEFVQSNLFENLKNEKFDIIVSNPPYIPTKDILDLESDVKDNEPMLALDGGESGLDVYARIIKDLDKYLNIGGFVFFEIGIGQAEDIRKMFAKNYTIEVKKDYNGIERIIKARRLS